MIELSINDISYYDEINLKSKSKIGRIMDISYNTAYYML